MFTKRLEIESILLILLGGVMGILTVTIFNPSFKYKFFPVVLPSVFAPTPTPTPSNLPVITQTTSVDSPDSLESVVLEKTTKEGENNYSLYVLNKEDNFKIFLFSKKTELNFDISIPFNTWSPDNRFVFIKEPRKTFLVWDTEGEEQSSNVSELFKAKYEDLILADVTGWAAPDLLIVNTKTEAGDIGPSLWFDVKSKSFIALSTRFN